MDKKSFFKKHIIVLIIIICYYSALKFFNITCPIKYLTGFQCPTCGVTRAMLSLLKGDINSYITYHPMALFLVISVLWFFHRKLFKHKLIGDIFAWGIIIANMLFYIVRIVTDYVI